MTTMGWFFVGGLWILFFWLYRDYRLDAFRQELFLLRSELFGLAMGGKLSFDGKAYGMLRSSLNGTIQFGHRWGFIDLLCFFLLTRGNPALDRGAEDYRARWREAIADLDPSTRQTVEEIRMRMHLRIAEQIIFTSATLMFTLVTFVIWILLISVKKGVIRFLSQLFSGPKMGRYLDLVDCAAATRAL